MGVTPQKNGLRAIYTRKNKGPFIFYEVGGLVGFGGGGSPKKNGLKGGAIPKKRRKGGVTRNILVHVELT